MFLAKVAITEHSKHPGLQAVDEYKTKDKI